MGQVNTEQTTAIIESVAKVVEAAKTPVETFVQADPWWQVFAVVGGTIATLLTAWGGYIAVKRRKK